MKTGKHQRSATKTITAIHNASNPTCNAPKHFLLPFGDFKAFRSSCPSPLLAVL